jgi:rhodanese-related sulfurtransferase
VALNKPPAPTATFAVQGEDLLLSIPRVTLADAKSAYDSGTAVFLDVRGDAAFQQNHIPGAVAIDVTEIPTRISELKPDDWIIPYCT